MGQVQFDDLHSNINGAPGCVGEIGDDLVYLRYRKFLGSTGLIVKAQGAGRYYLPASFIDAEEAALAQGLSWEAFRPAWASWMAGMAPRPLMASTTGK